MRSESDMTEPLSTHNRAYAERLALNLHSYLHLHPCLTMGWGKWHMGRNNSDVSLLNVVLQFPQGCFLGFCALLGTVLLLCHLHSLILQSWMPVRWTQDSFHKEGTLRPANHQTHFLSPSITPSQQHLSLDNGLPSV